jgi:ABC-type transport system substrate-binding protein
MTNTEKSVFSVIATVIKEQFARIGVTANIKLVDKVSWMNTTLQDGPWDMYVEDLLSLLTIDSNGYLSTAYVTKTSSAWSHPRHTDTKVDDYYARYARETDPAKRKVLAKEMLEYVADKMYWNVISGSPFYMVAQPWVKGYTYNAEFEVHWDTVWLDK